MNVLETWPQFGLRDNVLGETMTVLTTTKGQSGLPRYFAAAFEMVQRLQQGRLDFRLPDGRVFRAEGANPGPVAEITIINPDTFARLIRDGDLGFSEAYLEGWWTTPDLQGFMDLVHCGNSEVYDAFPGFAAVRMYERLRFWLQSNSKRQARKNIAYHYDLGNDFYRLWLDDSMTYSSALFRGRGRKAWKRARSRNTPRWWIRSARNRATMCWRSAVAGAGLPNMPPASAG